MTLINEISDRGAVVAWSPNRMYADVLCVGSKVRHTLIIDYCFAEFMTTLK